MSKVLFPSLRMGYLVLPEPLVKPFESLRWIVDDHGPLIDQATLALFIASGEFYTHIRRCRKAYAAKLATFLEAVDRHRLPMLFPFTDGGMNQAGFFEDLEFDAESFSKKLERKGLDVPSLQRFAMKSHLSGLVFGFTAFEHKAIRDGVGLVAKLLRT